MIKNILMAILVGLCVWLFFIPKKKVIEKVPVEVKEFVEIEVERVTKKIDEQGFEHAVAEEVENVVRSRNQLSDSAQIVLDSITNLLNIKDKQLKHYISYSTSLEGKLLEAERTDTSFHYKDKWARIEYVLPKDTLGNGHFNFKYNADVNYAEYWKRDWILGRKKHYVDFWIADPRATINGVKRIKFEPKDPFVKVDINASSYYTDRLNLGFDGGVHFGRTRVGGGYFYDMVDNKWRPLVNVKFNILEL